MPKAKKGSVPVENLLPNWVAANYVWLLALAVGLGTATVHLLGALWGWRVLRRLADPPASATERDLAGGRLVLALSGWVLITLLVLGVAAIAFMWPPPPFRMTVIRWLSGVGVLVWAGGMLWERRLRERVVQRERWRVLKVAIRTAVRPQSGPDPGEE